MPRIHEQLQANINKALSATDRDQAIEELEDGVESIDASVGHTHADPLPEFDGDIEVAMAEARTAIRNDDLAAARIRFLQVIEAGGPEPAAVDAGKPLGSMKKAELIAFAAAQDPPIAVIASSSKTAILELLEDELADREAADAVADGEPDA